MSGAYPLVGGIEEQEDNEHVENKFQRTIVRGVNYVRYPPFDSDCADAFAEWMGADDPDDPGQNPVNRHIRPYVYCGAVRDIGAEAADFLEDRAENTALPQVWLRIRVRVRVFKRNMAYVFFLGAKHAQH